ncbi:helix-turn-helix domain-containing protein [Microbacterium sp. HA-8]|uniref:helix-turn-helix transcriptional regulator n=1 Tax=Microbacterium sp. HA-8 TaxID=3234200 RepID=UPI0038F73D42
MVTIVEQVAQGRRQRGITQAAAAEISGLGRSNLSALESGRRDPNASTLEKAAAGSGLRLLAVDVGGMPFVADVAEGIRDAIALGDEGAAFELLVALSGQLRDSEPLTQILVSYAPPPTVTDHWDAAIAGVVEWRLGESGTAAPSWAKQPAPSASEWWAPSAAPPVSQVDHEWVPAELIDRGIWIDRETLHP